MLYFGQYPRGGKNVEEEFSFDLSAASWRHNLADEKAYVHALATRLEQALPGKTTVRRSRKFFSKEELVESIVISFETNQYRLQFDKSHGIRVERSKVVRGISLKTEAMEFSEWLASLSRELTEYAERHEEARTALERFLFS